MKFGNIDYLWCLIGLIPLLTIFYIWAFKRKQVLIERFVTAELKDRLMKGVSFTRQKFKAFLLVLSAILLIAALSRPKWGFHWEEVKRRGVDIIVALDLSRSMLAQDVAPNRLERAKREIIDLLRIVEGDRVGLVAFAGTSFLQAPLTLDYGAVQIFLDDLDTELIPIPGTALGEAIKVACKSFSKKDKKSRVLILITDGEDHQGDPVAAAEEAAKENVKIYTVGIGKEGGAPIPDAQGGFKKDGQGELILTHLDEETLQKIALTTGGSYIRSVSGGIDLEKIYKDIRKNVEDKELKSGKRKRFEERFAWPLILAIFLLILEVIFSERKRESKRKASLVLLVLVLLLSILNKPESAFGFFAGQENKGIENFKEKKYDKALKDFIDAQIEDPKNTRLKYNMANTYYKMGQYEEAFKLYQSVVQSNDQKYQAKSLYNLGNTTYRQGKLQDAVQFYKKALEINPDDEDTKYNLEFVRKEIKKRLEEQKKRQEKQKQQKQQQKNKSCQNPANQKQQEQQKNKEQQQKQEQKKEDSKKDQNKKKEQEKQKQGEEKKEEKRKVSKGQKKEDKDKLSKEEAKRWLSTLQQENRKKYLKKRMEGSPRYRVLKDW